LKKAQAVPKEKRYQPSEYRYAANLNNLEKARAALQRRRTDFGAATGTGGMPLPGRQADEVQSATLRKAECCYLGRPSATQAEQEKLRESLASLFPAYPAGQDGHSGQAAAEAGVRGSGFGTRELNLDQSGAKSESQTVHLDSSKPPRHVAENTGKACRIGQDAAHPPSATGPESRAPDPGPSEGAPLLHRAAEQIWKRRQHFSRHARREARQVMRLLSAAAQSPSPHSEEEALKLFHRLLEIFIRSRAVPRAQCLNNLVKRALWEMLEARYGSGVYVNGKSYTLLWQVLEQDYQWGLEQEKLRREERRAAAGQGQGSGEREQGTAHETGNREQRVAQGPQSNPAALANPESPTPNPSEEKAPQSEPAAHRPNQPPPLPPTFEEFLDLFYRAFAPPSPVRDLAQDRALIIQLAHSVWVRVHAYDRQVRQESEKSWSPCSRRPLRR